LIDELPITFAEFGCGNRCRERDCPPLDEGDQRLTAIEYGLIAALIAIAAIAAFTAVGTSLSDTFSYIASQL
jgi:pilus assembly protein Flp/PilA